VLLVRCAGSLGALVAALAGVWAVCRAPHWRLGLRDWKGEGLTALGVSLIQAMLVLEGALALWDAWWLEQALAFGVVVLGYKLTRRRLMLWRAVVSLALLQRALFTGITLLVGVP